MSFLNLEKGPSIRRLPACKTADLQTICGDLLATGVPEEIIGKKLGYLVPGEICQKLFT